MLEAILFGLAASSALLIGGTVGAFWQVPKMVTGILLAFASGALISALAIELFGHAFETAGATTAGLGLLAGAAVFVAVDVWLDTGFADPQEGGRGEGGTARQRSGGHGLALSVACHLDGVSGERALGVSVWEAV